jgi:molybdate transport system substrate-binding protein
MILVGAACGSSSDSTDASATEGDVAALDGSITVSAAASLTEAFEQIGDAFETEHPDATVTFNFGSSSSLARQIEEGAPADLFASADEASMHRLVDAGLIDGSRTTFARNQLTIVVKKGNPRNIQTLADLATAGVVSLCGQEVPCGRYADEVLTAANVTIPEGNVTRGQDVKATLGAVAEGDADAGIVYVTDVANADVDAIAIPAAPNAIAIYPIAMLTSSPNQALARAFIEFVLSPAGQAILETAGFLPPD